MNVYLRLIRFDKPIGTLLLLWPTLTALWLAARGTPPLRLLVIFAMGVFLMRSVGCILNDIADRNVDGLVARTRLRPLAKKQISVRNALLLAGVLSLCAFILVCFTNLQTILLSVGAMLTAAVYPFMKRITHWPQMVLGVAFAFAVPMAFTAVQQHLPIESWLLFAATTVWALAYDTLYAMVDREDDVKIGVRSTAVLLASWDRLFVFACHLAVLGLYLSIGLYLSLPWIFYFGNLIAFGIALYQQWLIRTSAPSDYFKAFLNNHWFGLILFLSIVMSFA